MALEILHASVKPGAREKTQVNHIATNVVGQPSQESARLVPVPA